MIFLFLFLLIINIISLQLPFVPPTEEKPEEEYTPVKGWRLVKYFGIPPTQYTKLAKDIIKAESLGSRASLFKEVPEKERKYSIISWRWKVSNVVRSAIETRKDRFDAAARVIVVFGSGKAFRERERGFGIFGVREPLGLKIEYIWATRMPKGEIFEHPSEKKCKVFVVESGEKMVGKWVSEVRNIEKDFKKAFEKEFPGVIAIGIQTDTDNSNEMVTAFYSEPIFKK